MMKIVVLAGGLSHERDVSLSSGSLIANALREAGHLVLLLDVYEGISLKDINLEHLFKDKSHVPYVYKVPETAPDLHAIKNNSSNGDALIGPNVTKICQAADKVFIALHGSIGENGQIQATFDVLGISYTGTGYIGSLLAMDKDISKKLMCQSNIPTPHWVMLEDGVTEQHVIQTMGLPCVVKPCSNGSSIGISMVSAQDELQKAIADAKKIESKVMIEKKIVGREFSVGILKGEALPVIEIIPKTGFYDYKNKYQPDMATEICPALIPTETTIGMQKLALNVHTCLRLGTYSRIDFMLDEKGDMYCLEANTLPGMTPTSLIPQEALAMGISYTRLCDEIAS